MESHRSPEAGQTLLEQGALAFSFSLRSGEQTSFTRSASKLSRLFVADAHRDGKRFIVRADEKLTAFVELERAIYEFAVSLVS
jgi:hypothetical protein